MSVGGVEMCRVGVSTTGLAALTEASAGFMPEKTRDFSNGYASSPRILRGRPVVFCERFPRENNNLGPFGSLGDTCSKETEVETY